MAATRCIEEERGTYAGFVHQHNGYYAGDFSRRDRRLARGPGARLTTTPRQPTADVGLDASGWVEPCESGQTSV